MKTILGFIIVCLFCVISYGIGRVLFRITNGNWEIDRIEHVVATGFGLIVSSLLVLLVIFSHGIGQLL